MAVIVDWGFRGQEEAASENTLPRHDPSCYLCPGNKRAQGDVNPDYKTTFVFVNDYSAVKEAQKDYKPSDQHGSRFSTLLHAEAVQGRCYVVTFSPSHNLTLADLSPLEITHVIDTWTALYTVHLSPLSSLARLASPATLPPSSPQTSQFSPKQQYRYMQIFENKGAAMGCSNPHPHGQVWITTSLPEEPALELEQMQNYHRKHGGTHLLEDYAALELQPPQERLVCSNGSFIAVCPWWATWPFETLVIPLMRLRALPDFSDRQRADFADIMSDVTRRYDNLFETHFPYSMGLHQAPLEGSEAEIEVSYFHVHFYPPLLRSSTVRKFLVGYEMLAEPQRDITPEQAARRLRDCGGEVYRKRLEEG